MVGRRSPSAGAAGRCCQRSARRARSARISRREAAAHAFQSERPNKKRPSREASWAAKHSPVSAGAHSRFDGTAVHLGQVVVGQEQLLQMPKFRDVARQVRLDRVVCDAAGGEIEGEVFALLDHPLQVRLRQNLPPAEQGTHSGGCDATESALGVPTRRRSARESTRDQTCDSICRARVTAVDSVNGRRKQNRSTVMVRDDTADLELSAYEKERLANIRSNQQKLRELGLDG